MNGKRWAAFKLVSMLLVIVSLASAASVARYNEVLFWSLLCITALTAIAYLTLFLSSQKNLHRFVADMESQFDLAERDALYKFPAPAVIIDSDGIVIWYNIAFTEQVSEDEAFGTHISRLIEFDLDKAKSGKSVTVEYRGEYFKVSAYSAEKRDESVGEISEMTLIYFEDITDFVFLQKELSNIRTAVILIAIDNDEDIVSGEKESEKAELMIQAEKLLEVYFEENGGIMRRMSRDKFFGIVTERTLESMKTERFKILDRVRAIPVTGKSPVTLSIGAGISSLGLNESEKFSKNALEMSQGRGGDQAAVKNEDGFEFFGGVSKGVEKQTKVKTRMVSAAIAELINSSGGVLIMGHKSADLDSVGAGAGLCGAVRLLNPAVKAQVVIDKTKNVAKQVIERLNDNIDDYPIFISPEEALGAINGDMLLIIVDTNSKDLLESAEIYEKAKQTVIIDHHRQTANYIENAVITHNEPFASSASEVVAEIIQYFPGVEKLQSYYADAMLSGIMLDTKNFIMKTGVRTFEAAAFLRKLGADMVAVKGLFAKSMECILKKSALVGNAEIYKRCAIAADETSDKDFRVACAQAADELLEIENVDASFVIFKIPDGINISARSMGAMNVQVIMEKLGGGGHHTMAAAQFSGLTALEAKAMLLDAIDVHIANIS